MRLIMIMFDTLTRKYLPNYGNQWVQAPNFRRLAERCTRFDRFYAGSLPCMPARRELHTGKYNFLHRGWGPLEPFDCSVVESLRAKGVYTHLVTDHSHYWEDGGATYHNRYDSWEGFRGQEGDRYVPHDIMPAVPDVRHSLNKSGLSVAQHYRNRTRQKTESQMSGSRTFRAGLDFLREHSEKDRWFLQIECFDPHEPFYVPEKYRSLYDLPGQETLNWPRYGLLPQGDYHEDLKNARREYAALLTLCDSHLGRILDFMDGHDMWTDTALIVNTDHGFLLGEHECLGKNFPPLYDELVHLPFFLHIPGITTGGSQDGLCSTVDVAPTILDLFGCEPSSLGETDGRSLLPLLSCGRPVRDHALFGVHGGYTCYTDGNHVFMKASVSKENKPLYEYTMMPTNIRGFFCKEQLSQAVMAPASRFTNGMPCMKIPSKSFYSSWEFGDRLYCPASDPQEERNLLTEENRAFWEGLLQKALRDAGAPGEEYQRLGLREA